LTVTLVVALGLYVYKRASRRTLTKYAAVDPNCDFSRVTLVFGYGSLVWKPPCPEDMIVKSFPGKVKGWHRRFWQSSVDHRGTPEYPGRVVTILSNDHTDARELAPGDSWGMCYHIRDLQKILPELDEREKNGYTRTLVEVWDQHDQSQGHAVMYYARPGADPAYVGPQSDLAVARVIHKAVGPSGPNRQYLVNLHQWCLSRKIYDEHITALVQLVSQLDTSPSTAEP